MPSHTPPYNAFAHASHTTSGGGGSLLFSACCVLALNQGIYRFSYPFSALTHVHARICTCLVLTANNCAIGMLMFVSLLRQWWRHLADSGGARRQIVTRPLRCLTPFFSLSGCIYYFVCCLCCFCFFFVQYFCVKILGHDWHKRKFLSLMPHAS